MKLPYGIIRREEARLNSSIRLTPEEREEVMRENERRGLLHLVEERNKTQVEYSPKRTRSY